MGSGAHTLPRRVHARLETTADYDRRFWEITVVGSTLYTRYGRVGTDGRTSDPKVLDSPHEAHAEAQRRIAQKRARGLVPVEHVTGEHAIAADLVAAIVDAPEDDGGYLVYADWLQAQGDPRGELVMLHYGLTRKPHDAGLIRAERQFQKQHGAHLLPPRLIEMQRARAPHALDSGTCQVEWRLGFVHKARIGRHRLHPPYTVRELLLALLGHPSAQLLAELTIGALGPERSGDCRPYDYRPVVAALCELAPPSLRTLTLADFAPEHVELADIRLGDVSGLFRSLPRLRDLHLRGGTLELGDIRAPGLRRFRLTTAELDHEHLRAVDGARWPELIALALDAGEHPVDIHALPALLAADSAPSLRELALTHTTDTREMWSALAASPLLAQLEVLDLSFGDLADRDVAAMLEHAGRFGHLRRLVLDGNCISRPYRAEVRGLCAEVSLAEQRGAGADLPRITQDQIVDFAPDVRSYMAAREVADARRWPRLGSWMTMVWGRYQGTSLYDVFVDIAAMEAGCTCPSSKYPCKHALGLLLLTTRGRLIPVQEPPPGLIDDCRASRYD